MTTIKNGNMISEPDVPDMTIEERRAWYDYLTAVPCPVCGAGVGDNCTTLTEPKKVMRDRRWRVAHLGRLRPGIDLPTWLAEYRASNSLRD